MCLHGTQTNIYYPKGLQQQEAPESIGRMVAVRTMEHKLIYRPAGVCELYDLRQDPQELRNRYEDATYADVRRALEARLLAWTVETADVTPFELDPRGLPA